MKTNQFSFLAPSRYIRIACSFFLIFLTVQPFFPNNSARRQSLVLRTGIAGSSNSIDSYLKRSVHQIKKPEPANIAGGFENNEPHQIFIQSLINGQGSEVRGVYVPGVFALPVVQQPETNPVYVSEEDGYLTLYRSAANNGVTGLLAHNYLSGAQFSEIEPGVEVNVIYGDGASRPYRVDKIHRFQKVEPTNLSSDLIDLNTGTRMTAAQVFDQVYRGGDHVTFQTCLEEEGNLSWGLLFITASPRIK